jgi:hypothetical protein
MCGQTAESFDVAEGGTAALSNEFTFSLSHFFCVAMIPPRWRQQGVLHQGVDVSYSHTPKWILGKKVFGNVACTEIPH